MMMAGSRNCHLACLMALVALMALPAAVSAQSLVQAARAAEEQRDEVGQAQRAFNNENLSEEAPPAVPLRRPSAAEAAAALAAPAAADAEAEEADGEPSGDQGVLEAEGGDEAGTRGEEYWRGRISEARAELARNETLLAALESRVNALTADFTAVDDPAQRQVIFDQRQAALGELSSMRDTVDANRETITSIQDEGRRAGVPAGWVR